MEAKKNPPSPMVARKQPKLAVVILLLSVVIIFVGSFLYFKVLVDRPEKVIADALVYGLEKGFSDSPVEFTGEIIAVDKTEQLQATFSGVSEQGLLSNRGNQHYFANLNYKKADKTADIKLELFITQEGVVYVKVQNLEEVVNKIAGDTELMYGKEGEAVLQNMIAKYRKKWIELSEIEAKSFGLTLLSRTNECDIARQKLKLDKSELETLKNGYLNNPFVVLEEDLGSEKINGIRSHHYKLSLNDAKLKAFTEGTGQLPLMELFRTCQQTTLFGLSVAELKSSAVELWVDSATHKITQLSVQHDVNKATSTYQLSPLQKTPQSKISQPKDAVLYSNFQKEIESFLGVPLKQIGTFN